MPVICPTRVKFLVARPGHELFTPRYRRQSFQVEADILNRNEMIIVILPLNLFPNCGL